jgi:hypothetical protein
LRQLVQAPRFFEVLESMKSKVDQESAGRKWGWQFLNKVLGDQHLATMGRLADAGRLVDGESNVTPRNEGRGTGVESHSHLHLDLRRAVFGR